MPEKTIETNHTTTPMKPADKVEETTRRYMRDAETTARDTARMWNDLITGTTNYYFDTFEKTMRYGMDMNRQIGDTWENMMANWRRMYMDNYKNWESYRQDANKIITRPR